MYSLATHRYQRHIQGFMTIIERIKREQLINTLTDEPVMTPVDFISASKAIDARFWFTTSRSEKRSPFNDLEHLGSMCADSLALLGVEPGATMLNLLAPEPHLSAFAANTGASYLGVKTLNETFEDYHHVIETGQATEVDAMVAVPSLAVAKAREIRVEYGEPNEVFPNLTLGMFGGEMLLPALRETVKTAWGLDEVREFYGSSELGLVAAGVDETRKLVPQLQHFIIEIETDETIRDIRDIDAPTEGSVICTSPHREAIELVRYRQGDRIRVYPYDGIPRIEPLGRSDNAINLAGAVVHPGDVYSAIEDAFGSGTEAVPYVYDDLPTRLELFVIAAEIDRTDAFFEALYARNRALRYALETEERHLIAVTLVDEFDDIPVAIPDGWRNEQVVFERSATNT